MRILLAEDESELVNWVNDGRLVRSALKSTRDGSLISTIGIVLFAPLLARWALAFGPAEYFALMCLAFACITGLMGDAPMKALLAAVIGLSLSTIGLDSNAGVYRFTGDNLHLSDGRS